MRSEFEEALRRHQEDVYKRQGVTVEIAENNKVTVKGPKGTLERELPTEMSIKLEGEDCLLYTSREKC